jgi:hypothetical protein
MGKLTELLLTEEDFTPKYQIYCDMDGVLTDFESRFIEILKKEGRKYYSKEELSDITRPKHFEKKFGQDEFWKFIDSFGEEFWAGMNWMPNGQALWKFISPYGPKILSSPSKDSSSRLGKRLWITDHLSPSPDEIIFALSHKKQKYSTPESILIDDKPSNIEEWAAKGGIALEVKDGEIQSVINKLKELGYGRKLT